MHPHRPARPRLLVLPGALAACLAVTCCDAAAPPRPIGNTVIQTTQLSSGDTQQIRAWAEHYCGKMAAATADPLEIEDARNKLLLPLTGLMQPSESFRFEYGRATLGPLQAVIEGDNFHAAVNATRVVAAIGGSRALDVLLDHCDRRDEPRWQLRLSASRGCAMILRMGAVPARQVNGYARRLKDAAEQEDRAIVLRRQLQAITAAATAPYPDDFQRQLRVIWAQAISDVIDQIARYDGPTELIGAIYAEVPAFRNVYLDPTLSASEQEQLGLMVGPALGRMLETAWAHAEAAHEDPRLKQLYGRVVLFSQEFLKLIDATNRPEGRRPETALDRLWDGDWSNGDREQFQAAVNSWSDILSRPPYER